MTSPNEDASLPRAHALLRAGHAASAERQLRTLEKRHPGEPNCLWLLGAALLQQDKVADSIEILEPLLARVPGFSHARVDLARAHRSAGHAARARDDVRRVLAAAPHHPLAWLAYGDVLVDLEQYADARVAFERARLSDPYRVQIEKAIAALAADDRKTAEQILRSILKEDASHVAALCGLASISLAADKGGDAERLLRHAQKQSAHHPLLWRELVRALSALGRLEEAHAAAQRLIRMEPENPQSWITSASVSIRLLRQEQALEEYEKAARLRPDDFRMRLSIGHVHKTLGRRAQSEAAYKAALTLSPGCADAYWSLADLKNYSFGDDEIAAMQRRLEDDQARPAAAAMLNFALAKAFEQRGRHTEAFAHYVRGNALRRLDAPFDIDHFERRTARIRAFFDHTFFAARRGGGNPSAAPIFIVGLPRSGSTLVEQILASHPQVEGTMELPNIITITHQFDDMTADRDGYPETVSTAPIGLFAKLGSRYLDETTPLRGGRERFTDKLPNNFSHVGLIAAMLPNATVIDARRHPMDSCLSTFKQHFAEGQTFSYDLRDLGRYYRCYLSLMDHWDEVLPGKVLHIQYEDLVRDPERHIRGLLDHCRLPFEPSCLAFHETQRPVRTASAEQVRRPIYTSGVGYWRHFEKELEPLREALGDALQRFEHLQSGLTSDARTKDDPVT
ncbi:MAG TPA: sulfotransferase [Steroidobacteraceae bacterium]|jgi:tetratricopeptide (TPR) repeat protein|nr:sulfotransferase [Steroidobacteraceae bacterium]